jgi:predicted 3-demethylubiquinone-9 3-methyltransferase (glyoxalase superfamily)
MESVIPFLMFEGRAREAVDLYTAAFPDATVEELDLRGEGEDGPAGTVRSARLAIQGQPLRLFDSPMPHAFTFTPAVSFFVTCSDADEVDRIAGLLSEGGAVLMPLGDYPFSRRYSWVNDRFGVSWQIGLPPV